MTIIAMWSGPRNISTALMYAFGNRADCLAWDEPFYGAYLRETALDHPMRQEILEACDNNWQTVAKACLDTTRAALFYQKHMTHHMIDVIDRSFIGKVSNAFLIRSPEKVLASYAKKHDEVSLHAIGFVEQAEIFEMVADQLGCAPPVIDADEVLADPRGVLSKLCTACGIGFDEAMLRWPKGPKPFDGVWAPHWYNAVWQSESFSAPVKTDVALPAELHRIADAARPYYDTLRKHSLIA
jgi:hypothetical protein